MANTHFEGPSTWPYGSLFFCGHFGRTTPASRRLNRDAVLGLALLGVAMLATALLESTSYGKLVLIPGAALSGGWILLAYRRYFAQLDELSLRIQHQAIAFSFSVTLLLGFVATAATVATSVTIHPLWIVIAEPLRGIGLVLAARKYR